MLDKLKFYIDGKWVDPVTPKTIDVINPGTEEPFARVSLGSKADVDKAVAAAKKAFETFSQTTKKERMDVARRRSWRPIRSASTISPKRSIWRWARRYGWPRPRRPRPRSAISAPRMKALNDFQFEVPRGKNRIRYEAVGVVRLDHALELADQPDRRKVAPALAAGCTMVLKPSEVAPLNAMMFAEVMDEAGVPPGVFNLVNGDGPTVGEAMSRPSGHRHDVVHRLDPRRHRGGQGRRRHGQARGAGTGRQVGQHRARGCRPDQGGGRWRA